MVKTTGAEWKKFYADAISWPEGAWHEDAEISINGDPAPDDFDLSAVSDGATIKLSGGVVFLSCGSDDVPSLETHFKRWRKRHTTATIVVEVGKDAEAAVRAAIKSAGGTVRA